MPPMIKLIITPVNQTNPIYAIPLKQQLNFNTSTELSKIK